MNHSISELTTKLFADGADLKGMLEMNSKAFIHGLTTNPTLMRKAGITNYVKFAKEVLNEITLKPVSFEVFSDEVEEMKRQALTIANWGENVYVKIPVTDTGGKSMAEVIGFLTERGVKVNVTALMTASQVSEVAKVLDKIAPSYVSVFAGRISDTGRDPVPIMKHALDILKTHPNAELIWASPRELRNIVQASEIGCHIITATTEILNKLSLINKDLEVYSLETVQMFYEDAKAAKYFI